MAGDVGKRRRLLASGALNPSVCRCVRVLVCPCLCPEICAYVSMDMCVRVYARIRLCAFPSVSISVSMRLHDA